MTDADAIWESKLSRLQGPNLETMKPLVELRGESRERRQERGEPRSRSSRRSGGRRRTQLGSLRLRVVKVGGRIRELLTKVRMQLASGHPGQGSWQALSLAFGRVHE